MPDRPTPISDALYFPQGKGHTSWTPLPAMKGYKLACTLERDRGELVECLNDALVKIEAYHKEHGGIYCGGLPNQVLLPRIRALLSRLRGEGVR